MPAPIYVMPRTPGATDTTEWTAICHSRGPFVTIDHDTLRATSRFRSVERKRQFRVTLYRHSRSGMFHSYESFHATLDHARRAAAKITIAEWSP